MTKISWRNVAELVQAIAAALATFSDHITVKTKNKSDEDNREFDQNLTVLSGPDRI